MVQSVGPHRRQLANEVEKLCLYVGDRAEIALADVDAVVTRNKQARAFALGDALGDRDLPRLLRTLDEELWEDEVRYTEIGNRPALRIDHQGARDDVPQGNDARRLDQGGRRITVASRRSSNAFRRASCRRTSGSIRWR